MGRIEQPRGEKGSLRWIQHIINEKPGVLDAQINYHLGNDNTNLIEWLSPLKSDDYAEYRDQAFLDRLGINLNHTKLIDFWPARGPQWDALGKIGDEAFFLLEAKAHITELISSSAAKSSSSIASIEHSLAETKDYLDLKTNLDLTKGFYQYSNRLAHLYFLRELNKIPAYLIFVYFINDYTYIPTSKMEWVGALQLLHSFLGTEKHKLQKYIIEFFLDVDDFK